MNNLEMILDLYSASLNDVVEAVASIPESAMLLQSTGLVNHPAWTLSHLANAAAFIASLLDEPCADVGEHDMTRYGPGSTPVADSMLYASKAELVERLTRRHEIVDRLVRTKLQDYSAKTPPAPFDRFAPTIGRIVVYLLAAHESYHLGQLMDWKRVAQD
jgi:hypothetical protein